MSTQLMASWASIIAFGMVFLGIAIYATFRTKSAESFAVGSGAGPIAVGISLATTLTSAAVFIVNPGLVYHYGMSAFLSFTVGANVGIILGLWILVKGFRKSGIGANIMSVPQWLDQQYGGGLPVRLFYAVISFLLVAYIVLIYVGLTNIVTTLLGINIAPALIMLIVFITLYNQIGGANSHVLTNTIQGVVMVAVAVILFGSGVHYLGGGLQPVIDRLQAASPVLTSPVNPTSIMFRDYFEVFFVNILIGFAIVCQPHIMSKGLFLKKEKDVNKMLFTAMGVGTIFSLVMSVGFFARFAVGDGVAPDMVIPQYIIQNFGPAFQILASLGIICAGISTLEAILLSFSVTFSFDIVLPISQKLGRFQNPTPADFKKILNFGRLFVVLTSVAVYFVSMNQIVNPNVSVAVFAFNGVYGLFAAICIPIAAKIFKIELKSWQIVTISVLVLVVHFGMSYLRVSLPGLNPYYWTNPGATATFAIIAGLILTFIFKVPSLVRKNS